MFNIQNRAVDANGAPRISLLSQAIADRVFLDYPEAESLSDWAPLKFFSAVHRGDISSVQLNGRRFFYRDAVVAIQHLGRQQPRRVARSRRRRRWTTSGRSFTAPTLGKGAIVSDRVKTTKQKKGHTMNESILVVGYADGYIEIYTTADVDIHTVIVPDTHRGKGEIAAEEYVFNNLPPQFAALWQLGNLQATENVRPIPVAEVEQREADEQFVELLNNIPKQFEQKGGDSE